MREVLILLIGLVTGVLIGMVLRRAGLPRGYAWIPVLVVVLLVTVGHALIS